MKSIKILSIIILVLCATKSVAQCPPFNQFNSIVFNSQSQINSFGNNYPNCTEIPHYMFISGDDITDLTPLNNVTTVLGSIQIENNYILTNINGLEGLTYIGGISIVYNNQLNSITGLNNLTTIGSGGLIIGANNSLSSISGFSNLETIEGLVMIRQSPQLTTISGFNNLTSIGESFDLSNNNVLNDVAFNNLTTIGGFFYIAHNNLLTSTSSFNNLSNVGGFLTIYSNNLLTSLSGFNNLETIGNILNIQSNPQLTSLTGFENLNSIGESISIFDNSILNDISALQNINTSNISGINGLRIENNPNLNVCNLPNFCTYLDLDAETHPRTISGNLGECFDESAVLAACALSVESNVYEELSLYPNPVKDVLYFESEIHQATVTDIMGKQLFSVQKTKHIDFANLQSGIYLISITTDSGKKETRKIFKI